MDERTGYSEVVEPPQGTVDAAAVERLDKEVAAEAKLRLTMQEQYRQVLIWPDLALAEVCLPVPDALLESLKPEYKGENCLRSLMDQMAATMVILRAAGIAAPQIGAKERVIAVRVHRPGVEPEAGASPEEIVFIINPEVVERSGAQRTSEGCLSFPGIQLEVERAAFVKVKGFGYDGQPLEIGGDGLLAVALQHEIDHLDGVVIADKVSMLKRELVRTRLMKAKKKGTRYPTPDEIAGKLRKERTT